MKTLISWKLGTSLAGAILLGALATLPARAQTYPTIFQALSPSDWWRFDETATSPALNSIPNLGSVGAPGTGYVVNAVLAMPGGIAGNCVLFTNNGQAVGNCSSRIDIPNNTALNPQPPFTIEFWAKPNGPFAPTGDESPPTGLSPLSSLSIVGSGSFEGARSGYIFYANPGGWEFRLGGLDSYSATAAVAVTVSTNSLTYVVGEFDGTTASLYINGVLAATGGVTGGPFQPNNFMPTRIGGSALPGSEYEDANGGVLFGSGNRGWDGVVSEVAIYGAILSPSTIMAHYTAGTSNPSGYDALVMDSGPLGYWNLEGPAYTTPVPSYTLAADSGSSNDLGTNTLGSLADQAGVAGTGDNSVFYSGVAGSLVLDTNVAPPNVAGETITLAAWINPESYGYVSDIIAQGYDETDYSENFLRVGNAFDWSAFQDDSSGGNYNPAVVPDVDFYEIGAFTGGQPGYVSAVFPAPAGDIGHWVYLVGTYDGANWNLFRNGQQVAQFADPLGLGPAAVETSGGVVHPWSVGSRSNPNQYFGMFFAGSIAEPAILTTALDAGTISNLYNSSTLPPVITQAPVAPSPAYLGSSASFSVWADGPGGLSYQWSSNGVPIAGQTATNYSLTGLLPADSATYSVVVTSPHGSVSSAVVLAVLPTLPPITLVPATETRWLGFPLSFAPASLPNLTLSYQWDLNGAPISGATQSSYTAATSSGTVGSYTLIISNSISGASTSSVATLSSITAPNLYVSTILGDRPLSYFRLDETGGNEAFDYAGGNNGEYFGNITLGVPGYSLIDTDTAAFFPGTALSYIGDIGPTAINFSGTTAEFSIEAWANGPALQNTDETGAAVIAKGHSSNGATADEQFAITDDGGNYAFFVRDSKGNAAAAIAKTGPDGTWHLLDGVCDYQGVGLLGAGVFLYIDGKEVASSALPGSLISSGLIDSSDAVSIGSENSGPGPDFLLAYDGTIDEVAIYPTNLSSAQVLAHYNAAYGPNLAPFITSQPVAATNYVSLPASLSVSAAGTQPLNYQWNQNGVPVPGATTSRLAFPSLAYANAGTYTVGITNTLTGGVLAGILSDPVTLAVLQPPTSTNPPAIGGLVLHLTFDNTLADSSGRGNDATNEASGGATLNTNSYVQGVIGAAFEYQTTVNSGTTNANYASLGVRPDLQFGTDISFSVSMWVQEPPDYIGGDLPFFCDVIGSTFGDPGFCFEPGFTNGTWGFSVFGSTDTGVGVYGDSFTAANPALIDDGNWHSLIYVIDRTLGATVYLDGTNAHQNVEEGTTAAAAGNLNSTNSATIGQDPTGLYAQPAQGGQSGTFNIDDLGVWAKALTPLEAASIYMAAISNQVSFISVPTTLSLKALSASELQLNWNAGVLQSATILTGPWTDVTGVSSPYTVTPSGTQQFFRVKL